LWTRFSACPASVHVSRYQLHKSDLVVPIREFTSGTQLAIRFQPCAEFLVVGIESFQCAQVKPEALAGCIRGIHRLLDISNPCAFPSSPQLHLPVEVLNPAIP